MSRSPIVPFERKAPSPAPSAARERLQTAVEAMDERSRDVFRRIVEAYVDTGEPVGSRTLSRQLADPLSPATIRNVMADLQDLGLLYSPHISAGRLPTDLGLRLFVDGLLEVGRLSSDEREKIEVQCAAGGRSVTQVLEQASNLLAGLGRGAGLVIAPKTDAPLKHVEFVPLGPGRSLVVLVTEQGLVENRVIETPLGLTPQQLIQASNFLSAHLTGRTLVEAREGYLIVRGQAKLLADVHALDDLERIRRLFEALEQHESMARILEQAQTADGVQIFIGAQNELFGLSGCTTIVAPYRDSSERIVGAIGVVGPTRLNYARIIPMVDYTARVIGRLVG
jgi:heat-inducible transcriptional repressor